MENPTISVAEFTRERDELEQHISSLTDQLTAATKRQADISLILDALSRLRGEIKVDDTSASDADTAQPDVKSSIKRIHSTSMVADLVNRSSRAWSRGEIHAGFKAEYGIPVTWENPATALNNAIARAVEKGLIEESYGRYTPRKVNNHA